METGTERASKDEVLLAALRLEYPDRDFHRLPGAWLVLPRGTPFTYALVLTGLAKKLQDEGWQS